MLRVEDGRYASRALSFNGAQGFCLPSVPLVFRRLSLAFLWFAAPARAEEPSGDTGVVVPALPPVDPDAIREAMSANQPGTPVESAEAYFHYLEGNLLAGRA